jgi:hypothetical protein
MENDELYQRTKFQQIEFKDLIDYFFLAINETGNIPSTKLNDSDK